jgi:predicted negative regulator of RcsB-dependent stress response
MMTTLEQDNREKSAQLARRVVDRYDDTPYATLSALALARLAEEAGEAQQARGHYDWVINNTRQPEMKHIARLRLARVVLSAGDAATAMGLVKDVESGTFLADYEELKGDIFVSMNDPRQARDAYNKALAAMQPGAPGRGQLQLKLDDLATTGQSPEASS